MMGSLDSAIDSRARAHVRGAVLVIGLLGIATPAPVGAQTDVPSLPRVRVDGNRFVGPDDETLVFRGFSISDPDKLEREGQWTRALFEEIRNGWNANVIRIPVHPAAWRERGREGYLALLDQGVGWAEEVGIHLIMDWHSIGNLQTELFQSPNYNTTRTETLRFWRTIAARYGRRPVVAFYELFNEPTRYRGALGHATWAKQKALMEELIYVIRSNGGQGVPLIAGFDWAYDLTEPAADPIDAEGVAYVTHPYPQKRPQPWPEQWQKDWGFMAERYPVMATELGFMAADAPGAHNPVKAGEEYGEAIVDFMEERGISWIPWVFDTRWAPQLIRDWNFTPTPQGRFFKQKLLELNLRPGNGGDR